MRPRTTLPALAQLDLLTGQPADREPRCTARGCPGRASLCLHDADVAKGLRDEYASRPSSCLNSAQNRDGVPYA